MDGRLIADMHTHTIASTHAYSTLYENLTCAAQAGLLAMAVTDHTPPLADAPPLVHFANLKAVPTEALGLRVYRGAEVNLLDFDGSTGLPDSLLAELEWAVASIHGGGLYCENSTASGNTSAYLAAVRNPYLDILGHSGNPRYPYDYETVVRACAEYGKAIEVNEGSALSRQGSDPSCRSILQFCKQYDVPVCVNSDAHFATAVGRFERCTRLLREVDFPWELVLNADLARLDGFVSERNRQKRAVYEQQTQRKRG